MKKIAFLLFLFQSIVPFVKAQIPSKQKTRLDTLAAVIRNEKLSSLQIRDSMLRLPCYNRAPISADEFQFLSKELRKRFAASDSLLETYGVCLIENEWYIQNNKAGKAIVVADEYYQTALKSKDKKALINAYDLFIRVYADLGMVEEWLKYARLIYNLKNKGATRDEIISNGGGLAWTLTQTGWALKNNILLDSAAMLQKVFIDHEIKKKPYDFGAVENGYGIYLMTLARLKRYEDVIPAAHEIVALEYANAPPGGVTPGQLNTIGSYISRIGMAYCYLDNYDSAFHYLEHYSRFQDSKTTRNTIYPPNGKYCDFNFLLDFLAAYKKFNKNKEAAELMHNALFSEHKLTDPNTKSHLIEKSAAIFEQAGMKTEAIWCYRESKKINDSLQQVETKMQEEAQLTNTRLQIEAAAEAARLEKEKVVLESERERDEKHIIIVSSAIGVVLLLIFLGFVYNRFRVTRAQKNVIELQKHIVEEKNSEITKSIQYALRIQTALLPPQRLVKQYLEDSFILYKPKDIVAGDFYWMENIATGNADAPLILIAACDCTGHGVPGAMVSVVCHNALNRSVREFGLTQPAAILDKTTELVVEYFNDSDDNIQDGMDIALVSIQYDPATHKTTLDYAGANNPLWLIQNGTFQEYKASKQPIGKNEYQKPFTNNQMILDAGDRIYLFTDGFADQFGGGNGNKKLTKRRFKDLIISIQNLPIQEQRMALDDFINEYKKEVEQIDDILVMGIEIGI